MFKRSLPITEANLQGWTWSRAARMPDPAVLSSERNRVPIIYADGSPLLVCFSAISTGRRNAHVPYISWPGAEVNFSSALGASLLLLGSVWVMDKPFSCNRAVPSFTCDVLKSTCCTRSALTVGSPENPVGKKARENHCNNQWVVYRSFYPWIRSKYRIIQMAWRINRYTTAKQSALYVSCYTYIMRKSCARGQTGMNWCK